MLLPVRVSSLLRSLLEKYGFPSYDVSGVELNVHRIWTEKGDKVNGQVLIEAEIPSANMTEGDTKLTSVWIQVDTDGQTAVSIAFLEFSDPKNYSQDKAEKLKRNAESRLEQVCGELVTILSFSGSTH